MREKPKPFEIYRHFKGKTYQIINIAKHSETMEYMVVYQQLYAPFEMYVRPLDMFMSEVDHEKYPEVTQVYRFERIQADKNNDICVDSVENNCSDKTDNDVIVETLTTENAPVPMEDDFETTQIDSRLMDFLDADTYERKLEILCQMKTVLNDHMIDTMAVSLDIEVKPGDIENRFTELKNCLLTMEHFECNRLR